MFRCTHYLSSSKYCSNNSAFLCCCMLRQSFHHSSSVQQQTADSALSSSVERSAGRTRHRCRDRDHLSPQVVRQNSNTTHARFAGRQHQLRHTGLFNQSQEQWVMPWQPWQKFVRATSWHAAARRTRGVPCSPPALLAAGALLRSACRRRSERQRGSC